LIPTGNTCVVVNDLCVVHIGTTETTQNHTVVNDVPVVHHGSTQRSIPTEDDGMTETSWPTGDGGCAVVNDVSAVHEDQHGGWSLQKMVRHDSDVVPYGMYTTL